MSEPRERIFETRAQLDRDLASRVRDCLDEGIAERGGASLVVSGGSTPAGFFRELAAMPLDWTRVCVTLADERWVPPEHPDSNARLLREQLLLGAASAAEFLPLFTGAARPEDAEAELEARLQALGSFDAVILGMGGDGHTASLFPGSTALVAGLDLHSGRACITVYPPVAPHPRLSLTLPRLLATRGLFVHITGEEKRAVLETARSEGDALALPIAAVLRAPATVYWAP